MEGIKMNILSRLVICLLLPFSLFAMNDDILYAFKDIRQHIGGDGLILEAQAYEFGVEEKGIKQDIPKAVSIYSIMYKEKSPVAAYKLGLLAWQIQKEPKAFDKKMIKMLEEAGGLDPSAYFTTGMKSNGEIRYKDIARLNGILLGVYFFLNDDYKGSIEAFNTRRDIFEDSISQMYLAFNYLALDNINMANYHINRACFHDNPSKSVVEFCSQSDSLIRKDMK